MRIFLAAVIALTACGPAEQVAPPDAASVCATPTHDSDGDDISDSDEGAFETPPRDTDHDGMPDYLDLDSDNDGIPDKVEARTGTPCLPPVDSDKDGKPDYVDLDSDSATDDTVGDHEEAGPDPTHPIDTDGNGKPDYMDPDDDGDHIADRVELTAEGASKPATTRAAAPDTDGDGTPDYLDLDSDNDTIRDTFEGNVDTDGDGVPNYRDLDSDGDCIPDQIEAGRADATRPPVDTDGDNVPDFESLDSDGEGLADNLEDPNCNGVVDACETDRLKTDTDGDGSDDFVEYEDCAVKSPAVQAMLMCQCDGSNAAVTPATHGDFVFLSDFMKPPSPSQETLSFATDIGRADVLFVVDSARSMQPSLDALQMGLASMVVKLQGKIKSLAFGLVDFKDFGSDSNYLLSYDYRLTTVTTAAGVTAAQSAFQALSSLGASGGGDAPEAGWEALYSVAGGPPINVTSGSGVAWVSALNVTGTPPLIPPAGESQGLVGGAGFRAGAVPIIITVADSEFHDAVGVPATGEAGRNDYGTGTDCPDVQCNGLPSRAVTLSRLLQLNAHVIGLAGQGASVIGQPKARALATAQATGAVAAPADFGPVGTRPNGCTITQCCTGLFGAGESDTPVGSGQCPLAFTFDDQTGGGVSSAAGAGVVALAASLPSDIHVRALDIDPGTVDNFISEVVPNLSGSGPAALCITVGGGTLQDNYTGPKAVTGTDGVLDTIPGVTGGKQVCFDVIPKINTAVMNSDKAQLFHAQLVVEGKSNGQPVTLGAARDVFFILAPTLMHGPIN